MSSSRTPLTNLYEMPVANFHYRQLNIAKAVSVQGVEEKQEVIEAEIQMSEDALRQKLAAERAAGYAEAEARLRQEFTLRAEQEAARISKSIVDFEQSRKEYFARVEREVVQLALAIAGKILHREAQVDPMLVAAIVQIALGQLKDGSSATLRLCGSDAARWRDHLRSLPLGVTVNIIEDVDLIPGDCVLETEMGSVNFSLDVQLKEVERGFFDVLAQKPQV